MQPFVLSLMCGAYNINHPANCIGKLPLPWRKGFTALQNVNCDGDSVGEVEGNDGRGDDGVESTDWLA